MPKFLDPTGRTTYGLGICARCSRQMFLDELMPDPNSPGLMVCEADRDQFDPWRLPAPQPDDIALPFCRPDVPLTLPVDSGSPITGTGWLAVRGVGAIALGWYPA